jgi:membrane protein
MLATLRDTLRSFTRHGGTLLGGALAFFALLSAVPTFVIALELAGRVTSEAAARAELLRGVRSWMGRDGALTVGSLLDQVHTRTSGPLETVLGAIVLAYGSTRLFSQTQRALNHMWDVTAKPVADLRGRVFRVVRKRMLAFAMVIVCAVFLLASTVMRAVLIRVSEVVGAELPRHWHAIDHVISFIISSALFTAVFKWLPDVKIQWRDAFAGALCTGILFALGKLVIARYLAHKTGTSVFGVAGSIVMVLLWVHYTAQIFFLGAAFTAVRADRAGRPLKPSDDALRVSIESL